MGSPPFDSCRQEQLTAPEDRSKKKPQECSERRAIRRGSYQAPELVQFFLKIGGNSRFLCCHRQPNGGQVRSRPHETWPRLAANWGGGCHRSSQDPPSGPFTLACPSGRLRCGREVIMPTVWLMQKHRSVNIMSRLILWRPFKPAGLAGLSNGAWGAMRALSLPRQCGCSAPLYPISHRHGTPDQGGQA